jgi:hypothetical protein
MDTAMSMIMRKVVVTLILVTLTAAILMELMHMAEALLREGMARIRRRSRDSCLVCSIRAFPTI